MQSLRRKSQKWRGLTTIFCTLLMISLCISSVISSFSGFFGGTPAKITDFSGETAENLQYFKSSYNSIGEMLEAKENLCEKISDEGIVLVKNDGTLPLEDVEKVTCLGRSSTDLIYGGSSGAGTIGNTGTSINVTLKEGLEDAGYEVNPAMWDFYSESEYTATYSTSGFTTGEIPVEEYPDVKEYTEYGDACIVVFARNAGEGNDVAATETSDGSLFYQINDKEKEVLKEAKENFDKVIVLINSPSALSIEELKTDEHINAILVAGGLGMNGAKSFGNILNGTVNPSGKLTDTYAVNSLSSPAAQNIGDYTYTNSAELAGMSNNGYSECNTKYLVQAEGIYIGYKYYETRYEDCVLNKGNADSSKGAYASNGEWNYGEEVSYSLGYGMSYTDFSQKLEECTVEDGIITATVTVKNTGTVPGKDVVQLYVQSPYTDYDTANGIEKASVQLVNFAKTDILEPDESETVTVKMDLYNICSYDDAEAKTWILEDGTYYFAIGSNAHDALNNILASKGKNVEDGMDYEGDSENTVIWQNSEFMKFENPEFSKDGFTTFAGTYHRTAEDDITNQLQNADLNTYLEDKIIYLTRSDWESSWPQSYDDITATEEMAEHLCAKVYEAGDSDTSGITTGADTEYQLSMMRGKSYDDEDWNLILDQLTMEEMMKMVGRNYSAIDPVASIAYPGSTVEDGPAGINSNYSEEYNAGDTIYEDVKNYSDISPKMYPSEFLIACTFNQELVYEMGEMFGEDSLYSDQTGVWAPGLNIHRTPYSGRNFEYFSEDSMISYILGAQEVAGMQTKGAVAAPKHFAFNDYETNRWGVSAFMTEQTARENSLRAFEGALSVGQAKNVMTALNRIGCDWVGLSDNLMNGILRNEWGFDGYTITDIAVMPYMYGYAVTTGTDKFLVARTGSYDEQLSSKILEKDEKLLSALRESCHRILYVDVNSNAMNGISENISIQTQMPSWKMMLIVVNIVIALLCLANGFMFVSTEKKRRKEQKLKYD